MSLLSFVLGGILGSLISLRLAAAVVGRIRRGRQLEAYHLGYQDGLTKGSEDSLRSGADDPATT